jgi:uncharacterized membrane protein (UPF0127 family)
VTTAPAPAGRRRFLAAAAGLLLLPYVRPAAGFEASLLTLRTADGRRFRFAVELALTPEERAQGLMFRESLAEDAGMLFVYESERQVTMWMKNTLIPLDMLFLGRDGTVLSLAERTTPLSEAVIASGVPVKAILELQGGTVARLGLKPGDQVLHPLLVP